MGQQMKRIDCKLIFAVPSQQEARGIVPNPGVIMQKQFVEVLNCFWITNERCLPSLQRVVLDPVRAFGVGKRQEVARANGPVTEALDQVVERRHEA